MLPANAKVLVRWTAAAEKSLRRVDKSSRKQIDAAIARYASLEHGSVCRVRSNAQYRLKIGQWRILFEKNGHQAIIHAVRPRNEAYRNL